MSAAGFGDYDAEPIHSADDLLAALEARRRHPAGTLLTVAREIAARDDRTDRDAVDRLATVTVTSCQIGYRAAATAAHLGTLTPVWGLTRRHAIGHACEIATAHGLRVAAIEEGEA